MNLAKYAKAYLETEFDQDSLVIQTLSDSAKIFILRNFDFDDLVFLDFVC